MRLRGVLIALRREARADDDRHDVHVSEVIEVDTVKVPSNVAHLVADGTRRAVRSLVGGLLLLGANPRRDGLLGNLSHGLDLDRCGLVCLTHWKFPSDICGGIATTLESAIV